MKLSWPTFSHTTDNTKAMRRAVFVSLFAVVLIYIAPLISQLQMSNGIMHHAGMTHHAHHMGMHNTTSPVSSLDNHAAHKQDLIATSTPSKSRLSASMGLEGACGYCTLLFHLNWLNVYTLSLPAVMQASYGNPVASFSQPQLSNTYRVLQPRAPPATQLM